MPAWLDRLKDAARSVMPARTDSPAPPAAAADDGPGAADEPLAPEAPNFLETVSRLLPAALLGVGGMLSLFAAQIGNWAMLGFLLLAAAPVVYQLQRVERRLKELLDHHKRRKK